MKFKDKNGNVFENITLCVHRYCEKKVCSDCALLNKSGVETPITYYCRCWAEDHPAEAARLMGYEVVEDNPCKWCKDGFCVNADSPMCADDCPVLDIPDVCRHEDRAAGDEAAEDMDKRKPHICAEEKGKGECSMKVTQERINHLMNSGKAEVKTVFGKCTTVTMQLENGFILTESSACVDPANYDQELGRKLCYEHIENRLWELEGYATQKNMYEWENPESGYVRERAGTFGWALTVLRCGYKVRRRGWNGKGIFIKLQVPDENSKMTSPYIYIDTTGLRTDNAEAPRSCVPWLASQTDMLAEDWEIAN